MKRILLFSLGAALALSSCSEVEGNTPTLESEVSFTSSINAATTRVTGNAFDEGDAISVFAKSGSDYVAENVMYESVGGVFTSSSAIVATGDAMSFIAVYPYSASMSVEGAFEVAADQSTEVAYETSDLLSAVTAATTETTPELSFNHSLSAIEVNVSSSKAASSVVVNALTSVDFDLESSAFVGAGDAVAITPLKSSDELYTAIVAPQTIAKGSLLLEVTFDGTTSVWNIGDDIELKSGYKYVCYVTVTDSDITFSGQILPWNEGGDIVVSQEPTSYTLADFSSENYPASSNTWVITDEEGTASQFDGLCNALSAIYTASPDRQITVKFTNLKEVVSSAMMYASNKPNYNLVAVGLPVATAIQSSAFMYNTKLVSISAPKVEYIGNDAFSYCYELGSKDGVSLPSLTTTGYYLFYYCNGMLSIDMPEVTELGQASFYGCASLTSVTLDKLVSTPTSLFSGCSSLVTASLPNVTELGASTFYNCASLASFDIPNLTTIGKSSFYNCDALVDLTMSELVEIGIGAFYGCGALKTVSFPKVTTVGTYAFSSCASLSSVSLPVVESIDEIAFAACDNLLSFTIPSTLTYLGGGPFSGCDNLTNLTLKTPAYRLEDGIIYDSEKMLAVQGLTALCVGDITLPSSVTMVDTYAFHSCYNITSLTMPSVQTVGYLSAAYCYSLKSASAPKATVIDGYAFNHCEAATSFDFPLVETVGDYGFGYCYALESISLPKATSLGMRAFISSTSLTSLELATGTTSELTYMGKYMFSSTSPEETLTLTVGAQNSSMIDGTTLTVAGVSYSFKEIIQK